jgi:hypothetical protein
MANLGLIHDTAMDMMTWSPKRKRFYEIYGYDIGPQIDSPMDAMRPTIVGEDLLGRPITEAEANRPTDFQYTQVDPSRSYVFGDMTAPGVGSVPKVKQVITETDDDQPNKKVTTIDYSDSQSRVAGPIMDSPTGIHPTNVPQSYKLERQHDIPRNIYSTGLNLPYETVGATQSAIPPTGYNYEQREVSGPEGITERTAIDPEDYMVGRNIPTEMPVQYNDPYLNIRDTFTSGPMGDPYIEGGPESIYNLSYHDPRYEEYNVGRNIEPEPLEDIAQNLRNRFSMLGMDRGKHPLGPLKTVEVEGIPGVGVIQGTGVQGPEALEVEPFDPSLGYRANEKLNIIRDPLNRIREKIPPVDKSIVSGLIGDATAADQAIKGSTYDPELGSESPLVDDPNIREISPEDVPRLLDDAKTMSKSKVLQDQALAQVNHAKQQQAEGPLSRFWSEFKKDLEDYPSKREAINLEKEERNKKELLEDKINSAVPNVTKITNQAVGNQTTEKETQEILNEPLDSGDRIYTQFPQDIDSREERYLHALNEMYKKVAILNVIGHLTGTESQAPLFMQLAAEKFKTLEGFRGERRLAQIAQGVYFNADGVFDPPKSKEDAFNRAIKFAASPREAQIISGYMSDPESKKLPVAQDNWNFYQSLGGEGTTKGRAFGQFVGLREKGKSLSPTEAADLIKNWVDIMDTMGDYYKRELASTYEGWEDLSKKEKNKMVDKKLDQYYKFLHDASQGKSSEDPSNSQVSSNPATTADVTGITIIQQ